MEINMRNNIFAVYANYTNSEHIEISSQEALSRYLDQSFSFVNSYKVRKRRKTIWNRRERHIVSI